MSLFSSACHLYFQKSGHVILNHVNGKVILGISSSCC